MKLVVEVSPKIKQYNYNFHFTNYKGLWSNIWGGHEPQASTVACSVATHIIYQFVSEISNLQLYSYNCIY